MCRAKKKKKKSLKVLKSMEKVNKINEAREFYTIARGMNAAFWPRTAICKDG